MNAPEAAADVDKWLEALGIPAEFHAYEGLGHGFGLGTGTAAEGWMEDAVKFWEGRAGRSPFREVAPPPGTQRRQPL